MLVKDAGWPCWASNVAVQLADQVPGLDSPLLRLVKERNAARELVKRLLYTAHLGETSQDKYDALAACSSLRRHPFQLL